MPVELIFARQERPAGTSTLDAVRALAEGIEGTAQTAAADAVAAAQPAIEAATQAAASDAAAAVAPAAADAIRAQVSGDADRAEAAAASFVGPSDRIRLGTGQWVSKVLFDLIGADRGIVFAADFVRSGAITLGYGTMEDAVTITRASLGRYLTAGGTYRDFAAGIARIGDRGLLIEPARTNLFRRALNLAHVDWLKARTTIETSSVVIAGLPAYRMLDTTVAGTHGVNMNVPLIAGQPYTVSVFAAAEEAPYLSIMTGGPAFSSAARIAFDLSSGTWSVTLGSASGEMQRVAGGWRCMMTITPASTAGGILYLLTSKTSAPSYVGTTPAGICLTGAQIEQGTYATTLIETTNAAATRDADLATLRPEPWWPAEAGTVFLEGQLRHLSGARLIGSGTSADSPLAMTAAGDEIASVADGVALPALSGGRGWSLDRSIAAVSAWGAEGRAAAMEYGNAAQGAGAPMPAMTHLGSRGASGDSACGYFRKMVVWNRRIAGA